MTIYYIVCCIVIAKHSLRDLVTPITHNSSKFDFRLLWTYQLPNKENSAPNCAFTRCQLHLVTETHASRAPTNVSVDPFQSGNSAEHSPKTRLLGVIMKKY